MDVVLREEGTSTEVVDETRVLDPRYAVVDVCRRAVGLLAMEAILPARGPDPARILVLQGATLLIVAGAAAARILLVGEAVVATISEIAEAGLALQ